MAQHIQALLVPFHLYDELLTEVEVLRARVRDLETVLQCSPTAQVAVSLDGTFLLLNQAVVTILKADTLTQLIGTSSLDLVLPEDRERAGAQFAAFAQATRPLEWSIGHGALMGRL